MKNVYERGSVWYADMSSGNEGISDSHEQHGVRPVVIISRNKANVHSPNVTVVPFTTSRNKHRIPTHFFAQDELYNFLKGDNVALGECVTTIDKRRLQNKIGDLQPKHVKAIGKRVADFILCDDENE